MNKTSRTSANRAALAAVLAAAFASIAGAQVTYYWDGGALGTGTSWATAANWVDDAVPTSSASNSIVIDNTIATAISSPAYIGNNRTFATITFSNANNKLPATLNVDANFSGSGDRILTLHSGLTLDTTTSVIFRGSSNTGATGGLSVALGANNTFSLSSGSYLQFNSGVLISGGFGINLTGGGTLRFNGQHTFSGGITVGSGSTLETGHSTLGNDTPLGTITAGVLTGSQLGTGTLTLQNGSTFRAATTGDRGFQNNLILGGNITIGGPGTGTISFNSGNTTTSVTTPPTVVLEADTTINALTAITITNVISGTGRSLTKTGSSNLTLSATNTYSGGTAVNSGTLRIGLSGSLGGGNVTLGSVGGGNASLISYLAGYTYANNITVASGSGGTLTIGSSSTFASNTIFSGNITLNDNLTVTSAVASPNRLSFTGLMSGTGDITKIGVGEWRVFGANSWSGNLAVNEGLANFVSGSQLRFTLGASGVNNSVSGAGAATFDGTFFIDRSAFIGETGSWNLVDVNTLTETFGGSFALRFLDDATLFTNSGGGSYTFGDNWSFSTLTGTLTAVPEPSTFAALAGLGALGFAAQRRRRRA
jgi:autotransporter-associated beta strand protein